MNQQHNIMLNFMPSQWTSEIRLLQFKHVLIKLPNEIISYLMEDQVFISEELKNNQNLGKNPSNLDIGKRFPQFEKQFQSILQEFDSEVFIKLIWRAPRDSVNWLLDLKCLNLYDVWLSLKSSGIIMEMVHDYQEWITTTEQNVESKIIRRKDPPDTNGYYLTIRKWYPINTRREYRCFINHGKLIAVSQRHLNLISPLSVDERFNLLEKIDAYYRNNIKPNFTISQFVMDIFIDIKPKERIILVDLNPWGEWTHPKLFNYQELEQLNSPEVRNIEEEDSYRMPSDFTEFENPQEMIELLQSFCNKQNE